MAERERERKMRPRRRRKKVCVFCADKKVLDYKDLSFLRKFISDRGKIASRRSSGCCARHQRLVAMAVKRARQAGLVPYTLE